MKTLIKTTFVTIVVAILFTLTINVSFAGNNLAADKPGKSITKVITGSCWASKQPSWIVTFDNGFTGCVALTSTVKKDDPSRGRVTNVVDYRENFLSSWGWAFDQGKNHMVIYSK